MAEKTVSLCFLNVFHMVNLVGLYAISKVTEPYKEVTNKLIMLINE
jgi:hypothetical protein